jgi:hypothetical protein
MVQTDLGFMVRHNSLPLCGFFLKWSLIMATNIIKDSAIRYFNDVVGKGDLDP